MDGAGLARKNPSALVADRLASSAEVQARQIDSAGKTITDMAKAMGEALADLARGMGR